MKTSSAALDYVFKQQKDCEKQPEVIGGNLTGTTKKEFKAEFREQEKLNQTVKNTITHFSVSCPPNVKISNEDAADFADELMRAIGYDKNPYIVVRHFDKEDKDVDPYAHFHIVASRINNDGSLISEWEIAENAIEATKKIDRAFKLESSEYVKLSFEEKRERNIKKNEYQMMKRTSRLSVLEEFKDCAESALERADGKISVQKFVADLQTGGFEVSPSVSEETGAMNGFSFSKNGIVFTAGGAGKKYKWANLSKSVNYQPEQDTKFLQKLKADFLINKEAKKAKEAEEAKEAVKHLTKNQEVTKDEATLKRPAANRRSVEYNNQTSNFQTGDPQPKEQPNAEIQITEVEKPARSESGAGLAQTPVIGAESPQIRDSRTGDAAARSGQKVERSGEKTGGNDTKNFGAIKQTGRENPDGDGAGESGVEGTQEQRGDFNIGNRETERERRSGAASDGINDGKTEDSQVRISAASKIHNELQGRGSEGFEHSRYDGSRISNKEQRSPATGKSEIDEEITENERADGFDTTADQRSGVGGNFKREIEDTNAQGTKDSGAVVNPSAVVDGVHRTAHDNRVSPNTQRFERRTGTSEKNDGRAGIEVAPIDAGNRSDGAKTGEHGFAAEANLARGGQVLQNDTTGASENHSGEQPSNRRAATAAAQIINLKNFGGQLNPRIVTEWAAIIEKSDAAAFLDEIIKPAGEGERQKTFDHISKQSALIAENLELPPPAAHLKADTRHLVAALTSIEVADFEEKTGAQIAEKTFELLIVQNARRAAEPPTPEQLEIIKEEFGGAAESLNLSSNLEAATLAALLDTARVGFDAEAITKMQRSVAAQEAAAQEVSTLIQIAYGGQDDRFTEQFKTDLTEQIYYAPKPATDTYRQFSQFDWQNTIGSFKPLVDDLAEQNKIEIKMPGDDAEREAMLAQFAAQQLINAAAAQNQPMETYIQTYLLQAFVNANKLDVAQRQKETIAEGMDDNLEPPEFSSQLEASFYNLIKYDEARKAEVAIKTADTIRGQVQAREEQLAAETQDRRGLTM